MLKLCGIGRIMKLPSANGCQFPTAGGNRPGLPARTADYDSRRTGNRLLDTGSTPVWSILILLYGALAQLGARHTGSVEVTGSNPVCSILFKKRTDSQEDGFVF